MKINDDHLYHGAALTQVAEHPSFKAINATTYQNTRSRAAFLINTDVGLFIKYASEPKGRHREFVFTFLETHLAELEELTTKTKKLYIGLVCISARHICCIRYTVLRKLIDHRRRLNQGPEASYTVLVTLPAGKQFRLYMNSPGERNTMIGERKVARQDFPGCLFA